MNKSQFQNALQSLCAEMDDDDDEVAEDIPEISDVRATNIRRLQLQEEFRSIMHEKFLSGSDADFDYRYATDSLCSI